MWSGERQRVWAFPQNLKRAATTSHLFSKISLLKILTTEKREIVAARFRLWGNAHTCWRSPNHKALLKCVISVPQTTSWAGRLMLPFMPQCFEKGLAFRTSIRGVGFSLARGRQLSSSRPISSGGGGGRRLSSPSLLGSVCVLLLSLPVDTCTIL